MNLLFPDIRVPVEPVGQEALTEWKGGHEQVIPRGQVIEQLFLFHIRYVFLLQDFLLPLYALISFPWNLAGLVHRGICKSGISRIPI